MKLKKFSIPRKTLLITDNYFRLSCGFLKKKKLGLRMTTKNTFFGLIKEINK